MFIAKPEPVGYLLTVLMTAIEQFPGTMPERPYPPSFIREAERYGVYSGSSGTTI